MSGLIDGPRGLQNVPPRIRSTVPPAEGRLTRRPAGWLTGHLRLTSALVVAALAAGCATRPPALATDTLPATPSAWAQPVPAGTAELASWWRVFGDPALSGLIADAMAANTDIAVATANLRQARAAREQATGALWPSLSAGVNAKRGRSANDVETNTVTGSLDAAWELDLFGATRAGVSAQGALERASAATLSATRVSVAAEVALAYVDLRAAQAREAVARANLASQEETLQITRWRVQAGLANAIDAEQATTAAEQTRAQIPTLAKAAAQSAHALAVLTGRTPEALLQPLAAVPATAASAIPQAGEQLAIAIPAQVLRQRPDVAAAEAKLRAAADKVGQADAARLPSLNLSATLAWTGVTLGTAGSAAAAQTLIASLSQPIFQGGALQAAVAGREAELSAAQANYRAQVLQALKDVEDALAGLSAARERLATLQRAGESARNASLLATQRNAAGLIDFVTVLDTQRTLLNVQDSIASARAELASAQVRLYKALGGGWTETLAETRP